MVYFISSNKHPQMKKLQSLYFFTLKYEESLFILLM